MDGRIPKERYIPTDQLIKDALAKAGKKTGSGIKPADIAWYALIAAAIFIFFGVSYSYYTRKEKEYKL